jgi:myo-inositol-1(or 4)-monophosphatase
MNTTTPRPSSGSVPAPARLLEIATTAAHAAAEHLRSLDRDGLAREYKTSSHDIVTEHDRASEEIIVSELRRLLPGCRIVGEEGGERPAEGTAVGADAPVVTFYVDPIDGTSNFAAGLPLFCVSIGAAIDDEVVAGVIDAPVLDQVFTAADGPAMLNGRPLRPRSTRPAADALVLSGFPGQRIGKEAPDFAARAGLALDDGVSSLELAYVAAGWADATALGTINSWDVAAGFHILRRAGGSVRTWPGRTIEERPDHLQPAYAACTGAERLAVLDDLLEELQSLRTGQL